MQREKGFLNTCPHPKMTADSETICFFVNKRHAEELMREVVLLFNVNLDSKVFKQGISDRTVCDLLYLFSG